MGSVNLDFNLNNKSATAEQSITYVGLIAGGDLVYVGKEHAFILINQLNYFKTTGGPLFSTGYAHFRVNFLRKRKVSYEVFTQVQYDDGRKMPFRMLEGGNVRIRLKNRKTKLYLGVGAMYERENWKMLTEGSPIIEKNLFKMTNYISYKQAINQSVDLNLIAYYQVGYDKDADLFRNRISGNAVLNIKLTDVLAFNTTFAAQYEDHPIIPINGFVYSLTNGLKWSF
ncbi:DUF481 domain-containing protein [Marinoscillum sp. MHG1-6]|uniref:DUF481 domain-containing protein n=1 Tax=Marinoscillum sp. MHG1-6 TaxID=2959627 RepID=UPI0021570E22|nr:DUF481 domain-containing protein [Marinoscillum sp. MHG1-6]